jgi:hypothetical protein
MIPVRRRKKGISLTTIHSHRMHLHVYNVYNSYLTDGRHVCYREKALAGLTNGSSSLKDAGGGVTLDVAGGDDSSSLFGSPAVKRLRLFPPTQERLMLFVRREREEIFTPLHLVPPTTLALLSAVSK